ncbi:hypothetical protein QFC22_004767 [Naganishia vaughanmartiniae]|uniref:Uncharacterized protein n=1 Tax=Naganishia vaughanmartiniae TaxID=1424756 RepID=A0ACC2X0N4_9TREE|nr:hypothetical protein QFC22_004767 [Naganishia vaughanmartiniae]
MIAQQLAKSIAASTIRPRPTATLRYLPTYTTLLKMSMSSAAGQAAQGPLSEKIIHDHEELHEYYHKMISSSDHSIKTQYQNQFVWELARHTIAEELVVYPAFEKYLADEGKAMADKDRAEHNVLKKELYKFQSLSCTSDDWEPTIKHLYEDLKQHIVEEEKDDLPKLEKAIERTESDNLAASFQRTKMFVPTRSHPMAPDKPPFETVAGLLAAPIDKLGDIFRQFPQKP